MKNLLTIYILLLTTLLLGCNDSTTGHNDASSSSVTSGVPDSGTSDSQTSGQPPQDDFLGGLVERSDMIFHGTLGDIGQADSIEGIPYTTATYNIHEVIAGDYAKDEITLTFVGGEYPNGNRLTATNSPNITLGEEAVIMVQKSRDTGCDIADCMNGHFKVEGNLILAANGKAITINKRGDVEYHSKESRDSGKHRTALSKMSVKRFADHLRGLDAKMNRKSRREVTDFDRYGAFHAYSALTKAGRAPTPPKSVAKNNVENKGSAFDQWEQQALKENDGNPVLGQYYSGPQD